MPYTIRELPPLPGGNYTSAMGINDSGVVVGTGDDGAGNQRALYWIGGAVHEIPTPTGIGMSIAHGVNAAGAIAGFMYPGPTQHGFLFDGVTVHDLGPAPDWSRAHAINDAGEIAGSWQESATNVEHPVMWTPALAMIDLGGFGFPFGHVAYAIANAPVIAGMSTLPTEEPHAFLWVDGVMHDLGTLGGARSVARGLFVGAWPDPDGSGTYVAGSSAFPGSGVDTHAFLWHKGTMSDLGTLAGWSFSEAHGINAAQQVVGYAYGDAAGLHNERAVLWDPSGVIADLNMLIADPAWDVLSVATAINSGGMIAGYGVRAGANRGFVLEPA